MHPVESLASRLKYYADLSSAVVPLMLSWSSYKSQKHFNWSPTFQRLKTSCAKFRLQSPVSGKTQILWGFIRKLVIENSLPKHLSDQFKPNNEETQKHTGSFAKQGSSKMRGFSQKNNPKIIIGGNSHPSSGRRRLLHNQHLDSAAVGPVCCTLVPTANYTFLSTAASLDT